MGYCPFWIFNNFIFCMLNLDIFQDYNLNTSVLSVFSHENSPLLVVDVVVDVVVVVVVLIFSSKRYLFEIEPLEHEETFFKVSTS